MAGLLRLSFAYAASAVVQRLLAAAVVILMARELSVEQYGRFGLLYAMQQGVIVFSLGGLFEAVVGEMKRRATGDDLRSLFRESYGAFAICAGLVILVWYAYVEIFSDATINRLGYLSVLLSGSVLAAATFSSQLARLRENHVLAILLSVIPGVTSLVSGSVAVMMTGSLAAFFVASAIGAIVSLGVLRIVLHGRLAASPATTLDHRNVKELIVRALPFLAIAVIGWLSGYGNNYIIEFVLGAEEVGYYTLALALASLQLMIAGALNQVWSPRFFALARTLSVERLERTNCDIHAVLAFALGVIGGLLVLMLPLLATLVGGNFVSYQTLTAELSIMFWGYVILTPWWQCANYLLLHGMGRTLLLVTAVSSGIGIIIWLLLMATMGHLGVFLGFAVMMLLRSSVIFIVTRRHWHVASEWRGKVSATILLVAAYVLASGAISEYVSLLIFAALCLVLFKCAFRRGLELELVRQ